MAEADISKIVNLIMENPKLIEEIKGLAEKGETEAAPPPEAVSTAASEPANTYEAPVNNAQRLRRRDLLCALKPYVSEERSKAIDSMLSISDILDMMKAR